ncbi:MAG: protein-S-isoprenylcysteine O-methyltransferase Ste14 [Myxococcota bacterium]|jgi:protein-S-isoprenylcysteine O-methyltransferase Ste14
MIWKVLFLGVLVAFVVIRAQWRQVWAHIPRQGIASTRERLLTSGIVFSQLIPAAIWLGTPALLAFADVAVPDAVRLAGLGICVASLVLLWKVHAALGAEFSPRLELREEHTLIERGPYKTIRHPMYTTGFLLTIGYGLLTANAVVGAVPFAALLLLVVLRLPDEEAMLTERFGETYTAYQQRTGRFFPPLRRP